MTFDPPPESSRRRPFAARRVRGYLVLGPVPPLRRWWPAVGRVLLALMLPFWIYTPLLAAWLALAIDLDEGVGMPLLFVAGTVSIAAGLYPLASWPCPWPFRLAATFVWAALLGIAAWPWTFLIVELLDY